MPRGPTGVHTLPSGYQAIDGETILASQHNPPFEDLSAAITESLPRTGVAGMTGNLPMGGNRVTGAGHAVDGSDLVTKAQLDAISSLIATIGTPSGLIADFGMQSPPAGWLECNGIAVSRTAYAALFSAIGTTWGAGDGSTTFNLPNIQGIFRRGWDNGRGIDPGRVFASIQADEIKSHGHTAIVSIIDPGHSHPLGSLAAQYPSNGFGGGFNTPGENGTSGRAWNTGTVFTGITATAIITATGGAETRPRNAAVLVCIKI